MPVIFLFLFIVHVQAGTLTVVERLKSYKLVYSENNIQMTGHDLDYNFEKNNCNQEILKRFHQQLNKIFTGSPLFAGHKEDTVNYTLDGQTYHEKQNSSRAQLLRLLPTEVRRLRLEELLLCKSPNKER